MSSSLLMTRRFAPLFWTQFFAAFSDNFLKQALIFLVLFKIAGNTAHVLVTLAPAVFIFPSLYEGLGLPPLEAMASGTPVVVSNVSSLPEVVGDAAVLVDPHDVDSIVDGLRSVLTNPARAEDMRRKGLERAREFSWERSVARTLEVYKRIGAPLAVATV